MKLTVNVSDPPLASLILIKHIKSSKIGIEWRQETKLAFDDISFTSDVSICRYLARLFPGYNLYGSSTFQYTEVDHWLSFAIGRLDNDSKIVQNLKYLDTELQTVTYLVSEAITIADIVLWSALFNRQFWTLVRKRDYVNLFRWYSFIESHDSIKDCLNSLPSEIKQKMQARSSSGTNSERKEEGKFIELPGAEIGKVVVRFPPEASGYLHIGHAKAALLNQYYQEKFEGKLIMRFDDTNPAKEKVDFEKVILEDLELLQIKPDKFTHSSDYFDLMLQYCEKLLKEGKAYVDDTDPEIMKQEREQRLESKNRANSIEKNFQMWDEMQKGTEYGQKCCVRAKIDMKSDNGCLRDPTIYRCKNETHPKTGDKYKVYPTYDFACPIVDSIEGVTHCLRTTEYHDRDDQFYWFIEALNLRKPYIWEYSRLNMTNTVLSKRKLTWFVEEGYVDGWDDPRFPTVRGILRHGMTVTGLKQFIIAQGSSRSVVSMEWDKIWAFNKKVIDPVAPRYTALESQGTVPVIVKDVKSENVQVPKHPKNEEVGKKTIWKHNRILIDYIDAEALKENENATFINWGNFMIKKINKDKQKIVSIEAEENLSNTDYKKTLKLTWLAELKEVPFVPCVCVYWDHIISKPVLGKDEDFKTYINSNTKIERIMLGDPELQNIKKGDIIQLQRRGFYICDEEYKPPSVHTGCATPVILFFIPDGHSKESPITALSKKEAMKEESKSQSKCTVGEKKQKDAKTSLPKPSNSSDISNSNILEAKRILNAIKNQGDRVRQLKADKSEKSVIDDEVKALIQLKAQFKTITNLDWKPDVTLDHLDKSAPASASVSTSSKSDSELFNKVCLQTSKIRYMQTKKFDKNQINTEVTILTDLKERYKSVIGREWVQPPNVDINQYYNEFLENLYDKVTIQGNKIRKLKAEKADNDVIALEVKNLLSLKAEYKEASGSDYKPPDSKMVDNKESVSNQANDLHNKIIEQGNKVRKLKGAGSTKEMVQEEVKILLELKDQFKQVTEISWTPDVKLESFSTKSAQNVEKSNVNEKKKSKPKQEPKKQAPEPSVSGQKKQTRLGLEAKKTEDLSDWYTQVITKGELIEYYDVSGCYILRPGSIAIWDTIREWFKKQITNMGIKECYFPIFVSKNALEKEKTHIEDFAPEVAWVTKSGESDLEEPVAIRPTSETIMYPAYAKWIRSHRDLPLRLNQWNNVVRWEFKHPQPFLRTREFLWQEGHTAFSSKKEAEEEVHAILDLYSKVYTDLLAVPVIKGRKTKKEQFAGSDFSTTIEAFISASGRGIQAATSHHLGQNFSKMFEIEYEDPETQEKKFVYQNSWGLTTRTIGVMIMIHGDDQGLVIPPRVAEIQVVIVPCGISSSLKQEDRDLLDKSCIDLENSLKLAGIKVHFDSRDNYSPGWKFNHWELKGVPVRIELGPKDIKQNQLVAVRRDNGEKLILKRDVADTSIENLLETIQQSMYKKAENDLKSHTIICEDWVSFVRKLNEKNIILAPFCGGVECEEKIKEDSAKGESTEPGALTSGAKSLCMPFEQPKSISASTKCINPNCSIPPVNYTLFGRSY